MALISLTNILCSLKAKYREFNKTLGMTGSGLTVADIRQNPHLSNLVGTFLLKLYQIEISNHIVLDGLLAKLPCWERLHGFWRTLPSYNPYSVSSEPGQNLVGEALELMQQKSVGNKSEESDVEEIGGDFEEQEVNSEAPDSSMPNLVTVSFKLC